MKCDSCGVESAPEARFCGKCGNKLARACPNCRETVPIDHAFCAHCGAEIKSTMPGLPIDRALLWRSQFERLGWFHFEVPAQMAGGVIRGHIGSEKKVLPVVLALLKQNNGPLNPSDEKEPWVAISALARKPYHIDQLMVLGQPWHQLATPRVVLVATRCRLLAARTLLPFLPSRHLECEAYQWYYRDFVKLSRYGDTFRLVLSNGRGFTGTERVIDGEISDVKPVNLTGPQTVDFRIQTGGRRFIDKAIWAASSSTSDRIVAASNMASSDASDADFVDIIDKFCQEIACCRAT